MTQPQTKLIIEDDAGKTIVVPFARDEITIGRKEGNTIRLTERNVSRFHAKLVREGNAVHVEDPFRQRQRYADAAKQRPHRRL